jgi:hypothetical protein
MHRYPSLLKGGILNVRRLSSPKGGSYAYLSMTKSRIVRILGTAFAGTAILFTTALIIGGGPNTIPLEYPDTSSAKADKSSAAAPENLTRRATEALIKEIGPVDLSKNTNTALKNITSTALNFTVKDFDAEEFFPLVPSSSFNISQDNSSSAKQAYIASLLTVIKKATVPIPVDPQDASKLNFAAAVALHENALAELSGLVVPKNLVELHRDAIKVMGAQKNILSVLQNHDADPLRALLASESEVLVLAHIETLYEDIANELTSPAEDES